MAVSVPSHNRQSDDNDCAAKMMMVMIVQWTWKIANCENKLRFPAPVCRCSSMFIIIARMPSSSPWSTLSSLKQTLALLISQMVDMRRLPSRWMCSSTRERGWQFKYYRFYGDAPNILQVTLKYMTLMAQFTILVFNLLHSLMQSWY